jgi:dienelactone hydrolase
MLPSQPTSSFLLLCLLFLLAGCVAIAPPAERLAEADRLAESHSWRRILLDAPPFVLAAYLPDGLVDDGATPGDAELTIYIEGDGLAWLSPRRPSADPTPIDPLALKLALRDQAERVAYLARPCQFVGDLDEEACRGNVYWTDRRFSPEVVRALGQAVDRLKTLSAAGELRLVGYSGGGALAALLAARRNDVVELVTVAGNLDHASWTRRHAITPLVGSLNPADFVESLAEICQLHFVGGEDPIVGRGVAEAFAARFPAAGRPKVIVIDNFDHRCCWVERWPRLRIEQQCEVPGRKIGSGQGRTR